MDKLLELLDSLVPAWVALITIAFGYLIFLFKKLSDRFISLSEKNSLSI